MISGILNVEPFNFSNLNGHWFQIWNNRYVQETNEIDWNCVNVNIEAKQDRITVHKNAILHGNPNMTIQKMYQYKISSHDELVPTSNLSIINPTLDVKIYGPTSTHYEYIALTGKDNLSLYTWVRDIDVFNDKYIHDVSNLLIKYQYTGYYKSPLSSYESYCSS